MGLFDSNSDNDFPHPLQDDLHTEDNSVEEDDGRSTATLPFSGLYSHTAILRSIMLSTTSLKRYYYVLLLEDNASKYVWCFPLKDSGGEPGPAKMNAPL